MNFLSRLLRRMVALAALVAGALLAVSLAVMTFVAAIGVGVALWMSARFGARSVPRTTGGEARSSHDVIDVEMREVEAPNCPTRSEPLESRRTTNDEETS